ncbi:unnamed protein product, partial [Ectocarpus fasciculatus]
DIGGEAIVARRAAVAEPNPRLRLGSDRRTREDARGGETPTGVPPLLLLPPRPAPLLFRNLSAAAAGAVGAVVPDGDAAAAAAVTSAFLRRCRELLPGVPLLRSGARPAAPRCGVPAPVA